MAGFVADGADGGHDVVGGEGADLDGFFGDCLEEGGGLVWGVARRRGWGNVQVSLMLPFLSHTASLRLLRWSTLTAGTTPAEAVAARRVAVVRVVKCMMDICEVMDWRKTN